MEGVRQIERARPVAQGAGDVRGEVPEVRQLQREREVARREVGAVRAERVDHARHGEAVLVLVFDRCGEGGGGLVVARCVAPA